MSINEILKPKTKWEIFKNKIERGEMFVFKPRTRKKILRDYASRHKLDEWDLKRFIVSMRRYPIGVVWIISGFFWIFSLSWIVQSIIALKQKFFWFPIQTETQSMFGFINIFWTIAWFVIPIVIIIWGIVILARSYEYFD